MSLNCGKFNVPPFWLMESLSAPQTTAARCVSAASSQRPPVALPSVLRPVRLPLSTSASSSCDFSVAVVVVVVVIIIKYRSMCVWFGFGFWVLCTKIFDGRRPAIFLFFVFFGNFSSCCFSCLVSPSLRCAALHLKRPRSAQRAVCRVAPVPYSIPFRQLPPLIFNIKSYF